MSNRDSESPFSGQTPGDSPGRDGNRDHVHLPVRPPGEAEDDPRISAVGPAVPINGLQFSVAPRAHKLDGQTKIASRTAKPSRVAPYVAGALVSIGGLAAGVVTYYSISDRFGWLGAIIGSFLAALVALSYLAKIRPH